MVIIAEYKLFKRFGFEIEGTDINTEYEICESKLLDKSEIDYLFAVVVGSNAMPKMFVGDLLGMLKYCDENNNKEYGDKIVEILNALVR